MKASDEKRNCQSGNSTFPAGTDAGGIAGLGRGKSGTDPGNRDSGADVVKILAIVLVIVHHVVDFGFAMPETAGGGLRFVWYLFRTVSISCINLFALATGYLCVTSSGSFKRLPGLWLQTVFTGVVVCLSCMLAGVHITPWEWLRTFLPVVTGEYWYFTAYFAVCLLMPFMNPGIRILEKKTFLAILAAFFLLVSIPSVLLKTDPFVIKHGYSFAWLLVLYFFGAYWRLHIPRPPHAAVCWTVLGLSSLSFLVPSVGKRLFAGALGGWFGAFNPVWPSSPFTLAIALAIFGLCRRIRVGWPWLRQLLATLSGLSFGMYLWLVHPVFWRVVWIPRLGKLAVPTIPAFLSRLSLVLVASFALAGVLELVRKRLFSIWSVPRPGGKPGIR